MNYRQKAFEIAKTAHARQKDKGGNDYILHPIAVAKMVNGDTAKSVALLHDVVEDTNITLNDLRTIGFPELIVDAIDCLTKRKNESVDDYLKRVKSNRLATTVKIADLQHNSQLSRIEVPTAKDFARANRYTNEINYLKE